MPDGFLLTSDLLICATTEGDSSSLLLVNLGEVAPER